MTTEPEDMSQELYDTIRTYVDSGHALHPEHARALLNAFEVRHRTIEEMCNEDNVFNAAFELVADSDGEPLIELHKR